MIEETKIEETKVFKITATYEREEDEPPVDAERISEALHAGGAFNYGESTVNVKDVTP